mmetsp:Transcript_22269/g.58166  ORF Transcript_22269/g.58166 Transcript_22269/m.58166 type:complete len:287 (-) Transcript_22269:68-928(-)
MYRRLPPHTANLRCTAASSPIFAATLGSARSIFDRISSISGSVIGFMTSVAAFPLICFSVLPICADGECSARTHLKTSDWSPKNLCSPTTVSYTMMTSAYKLPCLSPISETVLMLMMRSSRKSRLSSPAIHSTVSPLAISSVNTSRPKSDLPMPGVPITSSIPPTSLRCCSHISRAVTYSSRMYNTLPPSPSPTVAAGSVKTLPGSRPSDLNDRRPATNLPMSARPAADPGLLSELDDVACLLSSSISLKIVAPISPSTSLLICSSVSLHSCLPDNPLNLSANSFH